MFKISKLQGSGLKPDDESARAVLSILGQNEAHLLAEVEPKPAKTVNNHLKYTTTFLPVETKECVQFKTSIYYYYRPQSVHTRAQK